MRGFIFLLLFCANVAQAQYVVPPLFSTELPRRPERSRNTVFPPLLSFLLPGFDQWVEGQYRSAMLYSGMGLSGLSLAAPALDRLQGRNVDLGDLSSRDDDVRTYQLGSQLYMAAGSFSAYASFRSAVRSRQASGGYAFLSEEETVGDLLQAPFHFSYLARTTSAIPVALGFVLTVIDLSSDGEMFKNNSFTGGDVGFGAGASYLAGTNEEALFRGWMMPTFMEQWQSPFWSNTATSVLFAAAHLSGQNTFPAAQFVMGWYLGYLTQANHWTLGESVFVHAWWDAFAITGNYLYESRDKRREAWVRAPPLSFQF